MSIFIRGGYYAFSKKLLNITLKPTTVWHNGLLLTNNNKVISTLNPSEENKLELVYYGSTAMLLLNNGIIYENKKLFTYNLELVLAFPDEDFSLKERFASCIDYKFISCV
jgi:hypothetical protein